MPVNLPTHGHGHGYSDANFLIPELVSGVQYSKGPYFAQLGDFSAAGSAAINYVDRINNDNLLARVGFGEDGWGRALVAASPRVASGQLLAALEVAQSDGPWLRPDRYRKVNGLLRFSGGSAMNRVPFTAIGHARRGFDRQIPARALESGRSIVSARSTNDEADVVHAGVAIGSTRRRQYHRATGWHYDVNLFSTSRMGWTIRRMAISRADRLRGSLPAAASLTTGWTLVRSNRVSHGRRTDTQRRDPRRRTVSDAAAPRLSASARTTLQTTAPPTRSSIGGRAGSH